MCNTCFTKRHHPDVVTVDVGSLFPSIPQCEILDLLYNGLHTKWHLLRLDEAFIVQLIQIHHCNYFTGLYFQQLRGTAMGSAFSPNLANVFMSVVLPSFLRTQVLHPLLMKHFIDDLIILWPGNLPLSQPWTITTQTFNSLFKSSPISIDYLGLTIFKGEQFQTSQHLDLKAFQKPWINISTYNSVEYTSYIVPPSVSKHLKKQLHPPSPNLQACNQKKIPIKIQQPSTNATYMYIPYHITPFN